MKNWRKVLAAGALGASVAVALTGQTIQTDGQVAAQSFSGDGSALTNVTADDSDRLDGMDSSEFTPVGHTHTVADISGAPKTFYLTDAGFLGNQALTACASGYHMATLWEFREFSSLWYDSEFPDAEGGNRDVGAGGQPVVATWGWVRTGTPSSSSQPPGEANCDLWTNGVSGAGTRAQFVPGFPPTLSLGAWDCGVVSRVWCMED